MYILFSIHFIKIEEEVTKKSAKGTIFNMNLGNDSVIISYSSTKTLLFKRKCLVSQHHKYVTFKGLIKFRGFPKLLLFCTRLNDA